MAFVTQVSPSLQGWLSLLCNNLYQAEQDTRLQYMLIPQVCLLIWELPFLDLLLPPAFVNVRGKFNDSFSGVPLSQRLSPLVIDQGNWHLTNQFDYLLSNRFGRRADLTTPLTRLHSCAEPRQHSLGGFALSIPSTPKAGSQIDRQQRLLFLLWTHSRLALNVNYRLDYTRPQGSGAH
ncbi:hypothetical protein TcWFU_008410 [Taenia crassiceps]|uniref:Uncharacterized protein n=1 Tax=Taenia crassiceps TaxID=6207 RepID=A0ABR4QTE9_9CEST